MVKTGGEVRNRTSRPAGEYAEPWWGEENGWVPYQEY